MEAQTDLLLTCRDLYSQGAYVLCERSASILLSSLLSTGINFDPSKERKDKEAQLNPVLFSEIYLLLHSCQTAQGKYLAAAKSLDTAEKLIVASFGRNSPTLLPVLINMAQLHLRMIIEPNTSIFAPLNIVGNGPVTASSIVKEPCQNTDQEILLISKSLRRARNILEKIQQIQVAEHAKSGASLRTVTDSSASFESGELVNMTILEYTGHILHMEGMLSYIQNHNPVIAANFFEKAVRIRRRIYNSSIQSLNQSTTPGKGLTQILTILARSVFNWAECVYLTDKEKGEALHREAYSLRMSILQSNSALNPASDQVHSNRINLQDVAESEARLARICVETNKPMQGNSLASLAQKRIIEALEILKDQKTQIYGTANKEDELASGSVHIFEIAKLKSLLKITEGIQRLSNKGKMYSSKSRVEPKDLMLSEESASGANWIGGLIV